MQQDNAHVHTWIVNMENFHDLGYELLPHPLYSTDLASCDEVILETKANFEGLEQSHFVEGIVKLSKVLIILPSKL